MQPQTGFVYMGTYSDGKSNGIYRSGLHAELCPQPALAAELRHASWLHSTPDGFLLACSELSTKDGDAEGRLVSYSIGNGGALTPVMSSGSCGLSPCHIAYAPGPRLCAVSNYADGMLTLYHLSTHGELERLECLCLADLCASSRAPHAHCAIFNKNADMLFVCDLGQDRVFKISIQAASGEKQTTLCCKERFTLPEGCGPRHIVLSNDERIAYVVCELSNELMRIDASTGTILERHRLTDEAFSGFAAASALRMHPDQNMIAASCRGNDKVVLFGLDATNNIAWRVDHPLPYSYPRDIAFDPAGKTLWIAYERSAILSKYAILPKGQLLRTDDLQLSSPVSICFA